MNHQLKKIYKKIPNIACKGLCHSQCTVIGVSYIERQEIIAKLNYDPFMHVEEFDEHFGKQRKYITKCNEESIKCPMLNSNNRCSIYENRPMICRLYGVTKRLSCEHGCIPDTYIKDTDAAKLLIEIEAING